MRLAATPVPLPFASLKGRRSLLSIGNLIAAIQHVLQNKAAEDAAFVVADGSPVTIAEIIRTLRAGFGRRPLLLPLPEVAFAGALRAAGKSDFAERLTGDLVADAALLRTTGWAANERTEEALLAVARAERAHGRY
jgi:UDP-glucose 4-epimerase